MVHRYKLKLVVAAMLLGLLVGCSPEASRQRGAGYGTGSDPDNHPSAAEIEPCSKVFSEKCKP